MDDKNQKLRLWPNDINGKGQHSKQELQLLKTASKVLICGHFAVGISMLRLATIDVSYGMYISPKKGLLTFTIMEAKKEVLDEDDILALQKYAQEIEKLVLDRLLGAKALIVRSGDRKTLKFPYRHVVVYPNGITIDKHASDKENRIFKNFFESVDTKKASFNIDEIITCSSIGVGSDTEIGELESRTIFERLAPEYTVVIKQKENINIEDTDRDISESNYLITGDEAEYKTFFLDDNQVNIVNDIGKGHRVLLANAGAGKSIILLSKAFKYSNMYRKGKVLLTCYNKNLCDSYLFKKNCANFNRIENDNLYIFTLHKLVKRIYEDVLNVSKTNITEEDIKELLNKINNGEVKIKFKAIFIDEVQIFDPLYLDLCYALFDKSEDGVFLMAGDLNQKVRNQSKTGDASWKKMSANLDFKGRVKYIENNYRNCELISKYLRRTLRNMNDKFAKYGMIDNSEYEYDAFGEGHNRNLALKIKTGINKKNIIDETVDAINELVNKYSCSYSEIAILFPVQQNKAIKYYPYYHLTKKLDEIGIRYDVIFAGDGKTKKTSFANTNNLVISTIDSSLGLDFKAVILMGLLPYNNFYLANSDGKTAINKFENWDDLMFTDDETRNEAQLYMRKIFTACSRAREALYILSDLKEGSPIEELIAGGLEDERL